MAPSFKPANNTVYASTRIKSIRFPDKGNPQDKKNDPGCPG